MRYSHQRELILREVLGRTDHPTAEQICTSLRAECPRLSLGTVYRDLNLLVETGKLRRIGVPGEADRFDWEMGEHQHLYCRKCKRVSNLPVSTDKLSELVASCPGIKAESFNFIVTGLCEECAKSEA